MKNKFWIDLMSVAIGFIKILLISSIYLAILTLGMLFLNDNFGQSYGAVFIWFYLIGSSIFYLYHKNKESFTRENLRNLILKTKSFSKSFLIFLGYLILIIIGIIFLFLIGAWIAGLSATTIIIILLIGILLK
jgi:hypothetical protein